MGWPMRSASIPCASARSRRTPRSAPCATHWPRTRATRGWWRWARSGSTTSCRASTAPGRSASTRASCGSRATPGCRCCCTPGSLQQAEAFLALGFRLGFGGATTFDGAHQLRRLAAGLPDSALVLETDAPDIPPQWLYVTAARRAAGERMGRNEPAELPRIASVLAALRGTTPETLAAHTCANAEAALPRLAALRAGMGRQP